MTTVNEAVNQGLNVTAPKAEAISFGNGKYSKVAEVAFNTSKFYLGLNDETATKFAKAYASDLGRINISIDKISLGAINEDGYITIRESGKSAKIKCTQSMRLVAIINALEKAHKLGVETFKVTLEAELTEWLNS